MFPEEGWRRVWLCRRRARREVWSVGASGWVIGQGHRACGGCVVSAPAMRLRPADVRDGVRAGGASDAERARHAQGWMVAIGGRARCFDKNNN